MPEDRDEIKIESVTELEQAKAIQAHGLKTVNSIFEEMIKFTMEKKGKSYSRINKILKSHDKNRNYQSGLLRDFLEILIEMGLVK